MEIRLKVLVTFLFGAVLAGSLQASGQAKLNDIISYALEHSREVKKANYQIEEAKYAKREAIGHGLPQVEASASYSKMMLPEIGISNEASQQIAGMANLLINESVTAEQRQQITNSISGMLNQLNNLDALYTASAGIQVTQLIYSQAYWVGLKTAKKAEELYSILKTKSEEDLIAEVATGYYQAGSLMLQLQTVDKSLNNLKEIHRMVELSYQNDMVKESQVNRLKVTISNLEVTKQTVQNGITIQLNYLKALAGMPEDTALTIDTTSLINDFINNETSFDFNAENVPAYQALIKQNEVYEQQVRLSKAKYYPTLAAFAKISYSSYNTEMEIKKFSNTNTFGLSLTMPIFASGSDYAKVKQAKLKQAQLQQDILKTKDLLTVSYNNAFLEYQTSKDMVTAQKENKDLALKVYHQTSLQFQEGMASMADLLNVNSDFLQADNSYNQQILKCKTAEIKMLKASGKLKNIVK
ncbi:MAG TPA: TolC family protein [Bacteroidales bacterium]